MPLWVWLNCRGSTQLLFLLQFSRNARKMQSSGTGFSHQQVTGMANDPAERDVVSLCYLGDSCVLFFGEGNTLPKFWFLKSTFRHRSTPGFRKHCIIIHHNGSLTSLKANEHSRTGSGTSHLPNLPQIVVHVVNNHGRLNQGVGRNDVDGLGQLLTRQVTQGIPNQLERSG